jgi:membrane protein DedA with SNARE-associated domain
MSFIAACPPFGGQYGKMNEILLTHGPILSYLAITVVLILTGSGLPIPEEVPIIWAGVMSAPPDASLNPFVAVACCLVGALVGDVVMYWIGYHFGRGVLCEHRWWARCVTPQREARIEEMFSRHGLKVFFVARFLVGLRTPVYLTAGILRVSFKKFVLIDLICATAVVGTFFALTYCFGEHIARWFKDVQVLVTIAVVIVVACVAVYLWRRYRHRLFLPPAPKPREDLSPPGDQNPTPTR